MAGEKMITRTNAAALIPVEEVQQIVKGLRSSCMAFKMLQKLPNMSSNTRTQPVLSLLPSADFVNGDAGMKVTTNAAWDKKTLTVGEVAAIIPVPQAVIDDAEYNIWGETRPLLIEAIGRVIDNQVFSARNAKAPADWPDPIIPKAISEGNKIELGSHDDIFQDISALYGLMEDMEFDVSGNLAQRSMKKVLRDQRDANGNPLYQALTAAQPASIYSVNTEFVKPGIWDKTVAHMLCGDWSMGVYSIRQDMTFQIFDTGVISDDTGKVVYNLMQQDMVAMRVVTRFAWQIAVPIDIDRAYGTGYPFAVLVPKAA
jgi:HK97 family phage major capsid protein